MRADLDIVCVIAAPGDLFSAVNTAIALRDLSDGNTTYVLTSDEVAIDFPKTRGITIIDGFNPDCASSEYWVSVIRSLPSSAERALVVPAAAEFDSGLISIERFCTDNVPAVFPLSTQHFVSRAFAEPRKNLKLSPKQIEMWLNKFAVNRPIEVPLLPGNAGWIELNAIRPLHATSDVELAVMLQAAGKSIIVTDEAFVDDSRCPPARADNEPHSLAYHEALTQRHPYTAVRHPIDEVCGRGEPPPPELARGHATILHISHSWGGGLARWIQDFADADTQHIHLILKSVGDWDAAGKTLRLFASDDPATPILTWTLTTPILSTSCGSLEYQQILADIESKFPLRAIIVSTTIGHSLDVYRRDVPTLQVFHDFYPLCPPLYATWNTPCSTCDDHRLAKCLNQNPEHRFFKDQTTIGFQQVRSAFIDNLIERRVPLIAPTKSVAERWQALAPRFAKSTFHIFEHGLPADLITALSSINCPTKQSAEPLKILVLGSISPHKGGDVLKRALPTLLQRHKVVLLGCGDVGASLPRHANLSQSPSFKREDLASLIEAIEPDVALLLSQVPETFSYTLSELFASQIPTVATNLGAFQDRITHGKNGWLIEPTTDGLLSILGELASQPERLHEMRINLQHEQLRTTNAMVADYVGLLPTKCVPKFRPKIKWGKRIPFQDNAKTVSDVISLEPDVMYRQSAYNFLVYTRQKLSASQRTSRTIKSAIDLILVGLMKILR